jgi:DNA-binding MarR family transcriptional regulator
MDNDTLSTYFSFFNEIGIIEQLSRALLERQLPDGLLVPHFSVLNHLIRVKDGQTPLALARAFQVPKTTMTHTLSGLTSRDLVELRPNPKDGRSKCVWITEKGRTFRNEAIASLAPDVDRMAEQFPADGVARLTPELARIREYLDKARDEG